MDRTEALAAFKREAVAALSSAVVSASSSVKDFFDENAESLLLASMGIHRHFGRLECQKSNGFSGAFASLIRELAVARSKTLVHREVKPFIEALDAQKEGLALELRELVMKEYEAALYSEVAQGIQALERDARSKFTEDIISDIEATVRSISPEFISNMQKALFHDVTKETPTEDET